MHTVEPHHPSLACQLPHPGPACWPTALSWPTALPRRQPPPPWTGSGTIIPVLVFLACSYSSVTILHLEARQGLLKWNK